MGACLPPADQRVPLTPPVVAATKPTCRMGRPLSRPAAPLRQQRGSEAGTVLPPATPDYFAAVYPHLLKSPLPARIYNQGGVPAQVIPSSEITGQPLRPAGHLPAGRPGLRPRSHAFFRSARHQRPLLRHLPPAAERHELQRAQRPRAVPRHRRGPIRSSRPSTAPTAPTPCRRSTPPARPMAVRRARAAKSLRRTPTRCCSIAGLIRVADALAAQGNPSSPSSRSSSCPTQPRCNSEPGLRPRHRASSRSTGGRRCRPSSTSRPFAASGPGRSWPRSVMWDGREPSLEQQAIDATLGHAQAAVTRPADRGQADRRVRERRCSARSSGRPQGRSAGSGGRARAGRCNLSARPLDPLFRSPPVRRSTSTTPGRPRRGGAPRDRARSDALQSAHLPAQRRRRPQRRRGANALRRAHLRHLPQCRPCRGRACSPARSATSASAALRPVAAGRRRRRPCRSSG